MPRWPSPHESCYIRVPIRTQAVDLYRGDLCGDREMEWLIDVIPAWRRQYLEALAALATYHADIAGDLAQAERTARRLVEEEPTVMPYTQLLMRVRASPKR